jgi:hypothetical protein
MRDVISFIIGAVILLGLIVGSVAEYIHWNNSHKTARGIGNAQHSTIYNAARPIYQMPYGYDNFSEACDKYGNLIIVTANANTTSFIQVVPKGCK